MRTAGVILTIVGAGYLLVMGIELWSLGPSLLGLSLGQLLLLATGLAGTGLALTRRAARQG